MLNNSGESGHPCLVPDLRGNVFSFSQLRIMFAIALVAQSCLTLCDPMDCELPGSSGVDCHSLLQMFAVGLSYVAFTMLRSVPSMPIFEEF